MKADTIRLDKQALRLAEQATFDLRGTWIVEHMETRVTPAWRVKRDQMVNGQNRIPADDAGRGVDDNRHGDCP